MLTPNAYELMMALYGDELEYVSEGLWECKGERYPSTSVLELLMHGFLAPHKVVPDQLVLGGRGTDFVERIRKQMRLHTEEANSREIIGPQQYGRSWKAAYDGVQRIVGAHINNFTAPSITISPEVLRLMMVQMAELVCQRLEKATIAYETDYNKQQQGVVKLREGLALLEQTIGVPDPVTGEES